MPIPVQTLFSLVLLAGTIGGLYLWWKSIPGTPQGPASAPDTYTSENVRAGETYHIEQGGETRDFEVLSVHWSGFFLVRVAPNEGQELDRDREVIEGWIRELPANRLIEAGRLLTELPDEIRYAPRYN